MRALGVAFFLALGVHGGLALLGGTVSAPPSIPPVVVQPVPAGEGRASTPKLSPSAPRIPPRLAATAPVPSPSAPPQGSVARAGVPTLKDVLSWGNPVPEYPLEALERGWEGTVELEIEWDEGGRASRVRVRRSSGHPVLDRSARQVASRWVAPGNYAGRRLRVPVAYRLGRP